jgi:hypothetical protein
VAIALAPKGVAIMPSASAGQKGDGPYGDTIQQEDSMKMGVAYNTDARFNPPHMEHIERLRMR